MNGKITNMKKPSITTQLYMKFTSAIHSFLPKLVSVRQIYNSLIFILATALLYLPQASIAATRHEELNLKSDAPIHIEADNLYYDKTNDIIYANGNVYLEQNNQSLIANELVYDKKTAE